MPLQHKKLIGKIATYSAPYSDEKISSVVIDVNEQENVCGDIIVSFTFDNGDVVDGKAAFFSRSDIALARAK